MSEQGRRRWVVGVDIGIKNFAFAVVQLSDLSGRDPGNVSTANVYEHFELVHYENIDLEGASGRKCTAIKANDMNTIFLRLYEVLRGFEAIWGQCDAFVIEQQMQYRHASNIKALKLSQHVLAYFLMHYPHIPTVEYPAYHKTSVWKAPPKLKKHERKKWSIEKVRVMFSQKGSVDILDDLRKKDDVCDCILMVLAYACTNMELGWTMAEDPPRRRLLK